MNIKITEVTGLEIIDSRGIPTVQASVKLSNGIIGTASVPSGASTGIFEATELRDMDDTRFFGKGVTQAVKNITDIISPHITKLSEPDIVSVDNFLISLDGTKNKSNLGANATLAVSLAFAKASAKTLNVPFYRYLGGYSSKKMPIPMMNILNGGMHAYNNIDIQEFMIIPVKSESFSQGLRRCCEVYYELGCILKDNNYDLSVGDEGGFTPNISSDEEAIELILQAIENANYTTNEIKLALDCASSNWYMGTGYTTPKRQRTFSRQGLINYWVTLCDTYPIFSLEDAMAEQDFEGWRILTETLGKKVQLIGDDIFVTDFEKIKRGIHQKLANGVLIKPNQIGTLSETFKAIETTKSAGYATVLSHRSGETEDTSIADIAVATGAWQIKAGAPCRGERTAKYNRLLQIEKDLNVLTNKRTQSSRNDLYFKQNSCLFGKGLGDFIDYKIK